MSLQILVILHLVDVYLIHQYQDDAITGNKGDLSSVRSSAEHYDEILITTLNMLGELVQYYVWWCPGPLCIQVIRSHDIDNVEYTSPFFHKEGFKHMHNISVEKRKKRQIHFHMVPQDNYSYHGLDIEWL